MQDKIVISEHFHSIQGEGRYQGKPSVFLRVGGCNLDCGNNNNSTWKCDSKEVWSKGKSLTITEIINLFQQNKYDLMLLRGDHFVLTGGEPMLYQKQIIVLIEQLEILLDKKIFIEIETNGTILPLQELKNKISSFNISPKLSNSGELLQKRKVFDFTIELPETKKYFLKFVISSEKDLVEINDFLNEFKFKTLKENIYIMPTCETKNELINSIKYISELCKNYGYSLSNRLHLQIWDKKTGV